MGAIKNVLASSVLVVSTILPFAAQHVYAVGDQVVVQCSNNLEIISQDEVQTCDLAVDKLVSVDGGATFVEADTAPDAAQANVGDTIIYKIIVTNESTEGLTPRGVVYIKDIIPSGIDYTNGDYTATDGTYASNDSSFFENNWILPLLSGGEFPVTTLPATLILTTKVTATGLIQNTAAFNKYDPGSCDGGCVYADGDSTNDSNDAWIDPQESGKVLAAETLADTGSGLTASALAAGLLAATGAILVQNRISRKRQTRPIL